MAGRINADRTVEGNAESLAGLVNSKFKLHIPVFQRGYSWLTSDVTRFINDLWQAYSNRHAWFLGSLVTQSKDKDSLELYIIDGQQRLTTINLLMIALREISQLSNDNEQVGFFNDKLLKKTDPNRPKCKDTQPFLELGPKSADLFQELVKEGNVYDNITSVQERNEQQRRILTALELLLDYLVNKALAESPLSDKLQSRYMKGNRVPGYRQVKQYIQEGLLTDSADPEASAAHITNSHADEVAAALENGPTDMFDKFWAHIAQHTHLLLAKTYDLDWAFHVFRSMNDTGRALTDIDKLKALLLACWKHGEAPQAQRSDMWENCIELVGGEKPFRHLVRHMAMAQGMDAKMALLDFMASKYIDKKGRQLFGGSQEPAITFMDSLNNICARYHAMTSQDTAYFPNSLTYITQRKGITQGQETQLCKLFCLLSLMESGVRPKPPKGANAKAEEGGKMPVSNSHMLPALMFLHTFYEQTGKQGVARFSPEDAVSFFMALEKQAAFYYITASASRAGYNWPMAMQVLAAANTPAARLARYRTVVEAIVSQKPLADVMSPLTLSPDEERLFAQQLVTVTINAAESGLNDAVWKQIVVFLVRRHELAFQTGRFSFPSDNTLEHICPQSPKKRWQTWDAKDKLELTWSLGNLTLLSGPTNSHLRNAEFDKKCDRLSARAEAFASAKNVYVPCEKGTTWSPDQCRQRGKEHVKLLLDVYGLKREDHEVFNESDQQESVMSDVQGIEEEDDGDIFEQRLGADVLTGDSQIAEEGLGLSQTGSQAHSPEVEVLESVQGALQPMAEVADATTPALAAADKSDKTHGVKRPATAELPAKGKQGSTQKRRVMHKQHSQPAQPETAPGDVAAMQNATNNPAAAQGAVAASQVVRPSAAKHAKAKSAQAGLHPQPHADNTQAVLKSAAVSGQPGITHASESVNKDPHVEGHAVSAEHSQHAAPGHTPETPKTNKVGRAKTANEFYKQEQQNQIRLENKGKPDAEKRPVDDYPKFASLSEEDRRKYNDLARNDKHVKEIQKAKSMT